jgi:DNA-binding beta-propeller fold protein YncE
LIWWPINDYTGLGWAQIRQFIVDPAVRARTWEIINDRHYPGISLARWPNYQPFTMYIRRDIAREAWSVGPEPPTAVAAATASAFPRVVRWPVLGLHAGRYADTPLRRPTALAVASDGALAIVDSGNDRIVLLNRDGTLRLTFGTRCVLADGAAGGCVRRAPDAASELGDGQFQEPWGVAVGRDGEIYVADSWNGRIQVFDANGRFLRKWGRFGQNPSVDPTTNPLVLYGPRGLTVDRQDRLVVADTGNKRVMRFDRYGTPLEQVGGAGGSPGRFLEPVGLALSPIDGTVLVADAWNRRIQRLDDGLRPVAEFAVPGWRGRDALNKPYVIADAQGWIYAGSPEEARIFVYAADGRPEAIVPLDGEVRPRPAGLAVDVARGRLFVADPANDRIVVLPTYASPEGRRR